MCLTGRGLAQHTLGVPASALTPNATQKRPGSSTCESYSDIMRPVYGDSGPQGLRRFECGVPPWAHAMPSHAPQMMALSNEGVEDVGGGGLLEEAGHWGGGGQVFETSACSVFFLPCEQLPSTSGFSKSHGLEPSITVNLTKPFLL